MVTTNPLKFTVAPTTTAADTTLATPPTPAPTASVAAATTPPTAAAEKQMTTTLGLATPPPLTPEEIAAAAAKRAAVSAEHKAKLAQFAWTPTDDDIKQQEVSRLAAQSFEQEDKVAVEVMFSEPAKASFEKNTKMYDKLCSEISTAKTIRAALYGIDRVPELVEELRKAVQRGADVKIVVDINPDGSFTYPETEALVKEFGPTIMRVESRGQSGIMHDKFWVFDDQKVWTGSTNINISAVGKGMNNEISVLIESKNLAKRYLAEHAQMWGGLFHAKKAQIGEEILPDAKDGVGLEAYFSPKDPVMQKGILPQLNGATKSIYLQLFHFSDPELARALIDAKKARNVDVRLILDATGAGNKATMANVELLRAAGIPVKVENWGGKQHMKGGTIDGQNAIIGSTNWTNSGAEKNDENCLIVKNQASLAKAMNVQFMKNWHVLPQFLAYAYVSAEGLNSLRSLRDASDNDHFGGADPTVSMRLLTKALGEIDAALTKMEAAEGKAKRVAAEKEAIGILQVEFSKVCAYQKSLGHDLSAVEKVGKRVLAARMAKVK